MGIQSINNCEQVYLRYSTKSNNNNSEDFFKTQYDNLATRDNFHQIKPNYKKNLEELKMQGNYFPEEKHWYGTQKAQYKYIATGNETLRDIKEKFNLKDGAIRRCNSHLRDDDHTPEKGKEIFFYEEDVKSE